MGRLAILAMSVKKKSAHYKTTARSNVPTGRKGKHKSIVTSILEDLEMLAEGQSLKIPLSELPDTKVNIRSALNRASRKAKRSLATATDDTYLYVWNS
jgi:hypothetical protein